MKSSPNLAPIAVLVFLSILTKLAILLAPIFIPHTGLDPYDLQYFFDSAQQIVHGIYPPGFSYPPLALIPMLISYVVSFGNFSLFSAVFQLLMALCDAVVIACIYLIGLKFLTRQQSFIAGLLYALSLPVAYFSLTKFDSFPAALLMLAIYFTLYGEANKGYFVSIIGLFTKIYSFVAFPFLYIYNAQKFSKVMATFLISISVIGFIFRHQIISYIQNSLLRSTIYVNTPSYILGVPQLIFYIFAISVIVGALIYMSRHGKNNVRALLICIGVSILVTTLCMPYHSPQYFMWYAPIFCLLVADSVYATLAFCAVTVAVYLEFPIFYGVLYQNDKFLVPWGIWFFVIEWVLMMVMVYLSICNHSIEKDISKES